MKRIILILALMLSTSLTFAQETPLTTSKSEDATPEPKFTAAVDVVYPYLWRGIKYKGDLVAVQPYMGYAITEKLSVGVWATTNFSNGIDAYNEFDWNIAYQISPIVKVMLSDYYWPATRKANQDDPIVNPKTSYFD